MKSLATEIREKGYWETKIRPSGYAANRITDLIAIPRIVESLSIKRRGWDFPHVDLPESTQIGDDWVGQETAWEIFREVWRVTRSGQFAHLGGIRYDWGETRVSFMQEVESGARLLGIGDSLHRFSEIMEFAQHWANHFDPSSGVTVEIEVGGLKGRQLIVDDPLRTASRAVYMSRVDEPFEWTDQIGAGVSMDELWDRARQAATRLFERFGFQANAQVLENWQKKAGG